MRGRKMARNRDARKRKATPSGETAASAPAKDPSRFAAILRSPWLLPIPLVLVVVVYARVLNAQFQWDDVGSITQNLAIKDLRSYAAAMLDTGNLPGAEEWANRAIVLQPGKPRALGLLGLVKGARGDIDGALEIQRRAVAADPDSAELLFNLGKFHALAGHKAEACQALRRAAAAQAPAAAWHESIVAAPNQSGCGAP